MTEQWQTESADVFRRQLYVGEVPVALCSVCGSPVLKEHDPVPVYDQQDAVDPSGYIHGSFACMDQERCEEQVEMTDGSSLTTARCLLPANHEPGTEHFWGEPA